MNKKKSIIKKLRDLFRSLFKFSRYDDFAERPDSRELWKQLNPNKNEKIDIFLLILDDAFMVPIRYRFRIHPKDKIGDLYERSAGLIDSFEIEIMVDEISKQFGYELREEEISLDLNFEAIFSKVTKDES